MGESMSGRWGRKGRSNSGCGRNGLFGGNGLNWKGEELKMGEGRWE